MSPYITSDGKRLEPGTEFFRVTGQDNRPKIERRVFKEGVVLADWPVYSTRKKAISGRLDDLQKIITAKQQAYFALTKKLDGYTKFT